MNCSIYTRTAHQKRTGCMVTDIPEKKESCGCGGHGAPGGMDGMM